MAELGWTALEVTQEPLQNFMCQGYMTAVEFATYLVFEDPASPAPVGGYVMAYAVSYE
jgi:hypothetical protein